MATLFAGWPPVLHLGPFTYYRVDSATLTQPAGMDERGDLVGGLGVGYADVNWWCPTLGVF